MPYLIRDDLDGPYHKRLITPWQSIGAKAVVNLSAKLGLALLPPQTTFFKLQIRDDKLGVDLPAEVRSELDLSFSKMERMVMDYINASTDRVVVNQALKHLIVSGNALIFMGKDGLKHYPLNRFVVNRDGNGNVLEIVTKELISRQVLDIDLEEPIVEPNSGIDETKSDEDDVEVFTYVRLENGRWVWHQEAFDKIIAGSRSSAPKNANPWLVLRFNTVDGEDYGRGSSAAAKVIFLVSPSSTTKPKTLAEAGNGAIVQGRAEDVQVVQVGKTADFRTASEMISNLERRINEAFLVLQIRQSERTTAEEVRLTQLELEKQLGGLFSLLTVEFLIPYLNRTLHILQRNNEIPKIPKDLVRPQIVAGVNALGRGQDRESLTQFVQVLAQTMGPEALMKFIEPSEYIKRLAAAQGIDVLNLVKTQQKLQQEMQQQQQMMQAKEMTKQAGQILGTPMMDPSKNPAMMEGMAEAEPEMETPPEE